ncbi:MAG: RagB/SusD family nutrient uptake outer membrane protein, partial [Sphingobacteriaceae bacterium]
MHTNTKNYIMKAISPPVITRVVLLALSVMMVTACRKNLLEPTIKSSISSEVAFETPERVLGQVNDMYTKLKPAYFYGGRYIINSEIRGEEFLINKPNPSAGAEVFSQNLNSSSAHVIGFWAAAYTAINSANVFMAGLTANQSKIDPALYTQYIGEAKFVRALAYLDLVQMYATPYAANNGASPGIPLRLIAETGTGNNDLARSTVAEVYAQILADLNDAEAGLPATYATAALNTTRAHKNSAIALKIRTYLVMGNYPKVVEEASKIVSATAPFVASTGVNLKLETSFNTVFSGSYTGSEAILFLPFTNANAPGAQVGLSYYYTPAPGNAEYYLNPNGILANPALSAATDARSSLIVVSGANKWLNKFRLPAQYTDSSPVMRYAEVLLSYAEAAAETNDFAKATELLYAVRHRSDPSFEFAPEDIDGKESLISTILTERRIELLGEGLRPVDIQRRVQAFPAKAGAIGTSPRVEPTASNYIWPISGDELS